VVLLQAGEQVMAGGVGGVIDAGVVAVAERPPGDSGTSQGGAGGDGALGEVVEAGWHRGLPIGVSQRWRLGTDVYDLFISINAKACK
jgi:hypothetical protein